jgi:hypothetical protein
MLIDVDELVGIHTGSRRWRSIDVRDRSSRMKAGWV